MRKKFKWLLALVAMVASVNLWGADVTLAEWIFASGTAGTNYPSNKTNFSATGGICKSGSTFYLNGTGSQWNSSKGYAFTAVTDVQITVKVAETIAKGTQITFKVTSYYNKASNAPMKGFNLTCKEGNGSFAATGLGVTSWSLSSSSADKTVVYTTQNAIEANSTITLKLTQTGSAGSGQGYMGPISVTMPEASSTGPSLSVSSSEIDFGTVDQNAAIPAGQDVEVTFANLTTNDVTASITGDFNISKSGSFTSGDAITVTPKSTATIGTIKGTLTVKATTDDITKTVPVTMTVAAPEVGVSFEKATSAYTDWTFTNFASQQTHTDVTAHTGAYFGTTGGKETGSMVTKAKIAKPGTLQFFISKQSTNTNASNWKVSVSTDKSVWTLVNTTSATDMTKGIWKEVKVDLKEYSNVYVKIEYAGSSAVRCIDDVVFIAPQSYSVTLSTNPASVGTVTAKVNNVVIGEQVEEGQTVTLSAAPNDAYAYRFKEWQSDDVTIEDNAFDMPSKAVSITAVFEPLYAVSLTIAGEGSGTATINGGAGPVYVSASDEITLVAENAAGSEFAGWTASDNDHIVFDDASAGSTTATVDAAVTITATFNKKQCTILGTPQNVQVTDKTYSGAKLTWSAVTNADYYEVYIKKGTDDVESDLVEGTEYTISSTLSANTEYSYSIIATPENEDTYCASNPVEDNFTTADYPAVVLTLSENETTSTKDGKLNTAITLPTTSTQACEGKVFVGWSENPIEGEAATATLLGETYTFTDPSVSEKTIYAVYAKKTEGTAQTIFSENFDACEGTGGNDDEWSGSIASATLPTSITGWTFTKGNAADACAKFGTGSAAGSAQTPALEFTGKATLTFRAGAWSGDAKTLNITTTSGIVTPTSITLADAAFTSYEIVITDATENPQITIAAAQASKNRFFLDDVVVKAAGEPTYSNYCTTCTAAIVPPTFSLTEKSYTEPKTLELTAPEGDIYYTINDGTETLYEEAIKLENRGTYEIFAYAKVDERTSDIVTNTYTLDWAYNLDELVAEGAPTTAGRTVTVILTDEVIESFAISGSYVNGFFTMVGDKKIEVYCKNSPATWEVGGKVSGTVTCPWKLYNSTWELCPTDWDWASYTAPAKITSLEITGDVDNKNYTAGQKLDFTGLTVLGVYNDNTEQNPHKDNVTADVVWTEVTLTQGQVSATATATLNNVETGNKDVSKSIEITGLTVGAAKTLESIYVDNEHSTHKKAFFVGRSFSAEGLKVMAHYNMDEDQQIAVANLDITNTTFSEAEAEHAINISYTENGVTKTTSYNVAVKYMNLSELVAEDVPTNTSVKVAFSDVEITGFYTNSSDKRTGVYVNVIGKNGANIELYSGGTPSATLNDWQEGGLISSKGDYITGTWKYYDGGSVWEIDFGSNYAWSTNIEYTAPVIYPTAIALTKTEETVKQAKSLDLEAIFTPIDATVLNNLEWSSDNNQVTVAPSQDKKSAIVTVAPDATVGTATITVSVDDENGQKLSATCFITIQEYSVPRYGLYYGELTEGDYLITYNYNGLGAMNTTITSNRAGITSVTPINNIIASEDEDIVWHIAKSGDNWTLYNAEANKYAAGNGTNNQIALVDAATADAAKWTVTIKEEDTYEFVNVGNSASSKNANLRRNTNSGFACYSASLTNSGALTLYKADFTPAAALQSIEIQGTLKSKCFQGKSVKYDGLSVLGHYSDNTSALITEGIVWSADPTSFTELGEQTVTITATVQTKSGEVKDDAEFNVTVVAPVVADYELVENVNDLNDGAAIILGAVFGTEAAPIYAVNQGFESKYLAAYRSNTEDSDLEYANKTMRTANASEITLKKVEGGWKLMDEYGKYIISNNADIALSENADEATVWTITITEGVAEIASGNNVIRYNTSAPRFKTYTESSQTIINCGIYMKPFVTVRENLTVGSYGTVCWPKDVVAYTGATFYQADYKDEGAHEMYFNKVDDVEKLNAGQAYLFQATDATIQFMEGTEQALDPISGTAARGFYGVYERQTCLADYEWYGVYGTKIQPMAAGAGVPANRAYIKLDEVPTESYVEAGAPAPRRLAMVMPKSTATDLYLIYNPEEGTRKVMMNNHVMIIRNNRMYNAQGQFMKVNK